jgi:predicted transposase YbfD/YdcC
MISPALKRRLYITSSSNDPARLAHAVRRHWEVEVMHWTIDCLFRDDDCRVRIKHAPANVTAIKHRALNLRRRSPGKGIPDHKETQGPDGTTTSSKI